MAGDRIAGIHVPYRSLVELRAAYTLKLVRRPKSPYWIIRGTLRGIRIDQSTGVSEKRAAEEIRAKREAEILAESVYGRRATVTFASAAVTYLEHGGSKRFLEPIIEHFGTTLATPPVGSSCATTHQYAEAVISLSMVQLAETSEWTDTEVSMKLTARLERHGPRGPSLAGCSTVGGDSARFSAQFRVTRASVDFERSSKPLRKQS